MKPEDVVVHYRCCGKDNIVPGVYTGQHADYKLVCSICGGSANYAHDVSADYQPTADEVEADGKLHIYLHSCTDKHCDGQ